MEMVDRTNLKTPAILIISWCQKIFCSHDTYGLLRTLCHWYPIINSMVEPSYQTATPFFPHQTTTGSSNPFHACKISSLVASSSEHAVAPPAAVPNLNAAFQS